MSDTRTINLRDGIYKRIFNNKKMTFEILDRINGEIKGFGFKNNEFQKILESDKNIHSGVTLYRNLILTEETCLVMNLDPLLQRVKFGHEYSPLQLLRNRDYLIRFNFREYFDRGRGLTSTFNCVSCGELMPAGNLTQYCRVPAFPQFEFKCFSPSFLAADLLKKHLDEYGEREILQWMYCAICGLIMGEEYIHAGLAGNENHAVSAMVHDFCIESKVRSSKLTDMRRETIMACGMKATDTFSSGQMHYKKYLHNAKTFIQKEDLLKEEALNSFVSLSNELGFAESIAPYHKY